MSRSTRLHMHAVRDTGFIAVEEIAQKLQFPDDCMRHCGRLAALLDGEIPNTPASKKLFYNKLNTAQACDGQEKKFLGRTACGADL